MHSKQGEQQRCQVVPKLSFDQFSARCMVEFVFYSILAGSQGQAASQLQYGGYQLATIEIANSKFEI